MAARRTLVQLLATVRYNLDDSGATQRFTDAQLTDSLNRSKDRVWNEVRKERADYFLSLRKSTDGSVTILGESYATSSLAIPVGPTTGVATDLSLPPDFAELRTFRVITSGYEWVPIYQRRVTDLDYRAARSEPDALSPVAFWAAVIDEHSLSYGPKSNTALDTELVYIYQPPDMDSVTVTNLEMPYPMDLAVEAFATATSLLQDYADEAAVWEQRAQRHVADIVGASQRSSQDPVIVESADSGWV